MSQKVLADRYVLKSELGRGGMAVVYRAHDLRLNRYVAIKLLHPHLASQAESAERFVRESQAIAKLNHPNVIRVYDAAQDPESKAHFLVTELIEGPTLREFIEANEIYVPELAVAMTACLADALDHAHSEGIIHRDIKPENVMIDADGCLRLMDFGIARVLDSERMTASGSLLGSPAHMPPEIIEGQSYDGRCDIFSLGTVLYYCLTQTLPFRGETPMAVFKAILLGSYTPASRIHSYISRSCDKVVAKCLSVDPEGRYRTPAELKGDLLALLTAAAMEDYVEILKKFFKDPQNYQKECLNALILHFNERAVALTKAKQMPLALDLLNRVLTYDPDNSQAREALSRIRVSHLRLRVIQALAIFALFLATLGAVYYFWEDSIEPKTTLQTAISASEYRKALNEEKLQHLETLYAQAIEARPEQASILPRPASSLDREVTLSYCVGDPRLGSQYLAAKQRDDDGQSTANATKEMGEKSEAKEGSPSATAEAQKSEAPEGAKNADARALRSHRRDTTRVTAAQGSARAQAAQARAEAQAAAQAAAAQRAAQEQTSSQKPTSSTGAALASNKANQGLGKNEGKLTETATKNVQKVRVIQPVFPADAYAIIRGKRYQANGSGDIEFELERGRHNVVLNCPERCLSKRIHIDIGDNESEKKLDVVSLDWADATLQLYPPSDTEVYFVARRLDDKGSRIIHLVSRSPNAISGFNAFGRPIQLEVYAIPKTRSVSSYDAAALERAKLASTRIALKPGDSRSIQY